MKRRALLLAPVALAVAGCCTPPRRVVAYYVTGEDLADNKITMRTLSAEQAKAFTQRHTEFMFDVKVIYA